jgi:hypothetical protein
MNAVVTDRALLPFWRSVVHLVRFDLRRFRVFVAVIAGLEIVRASAVEWALHLAPTVDGESFGGVFDAQDALFGAVLIAATMAATAAIVQADRPSDDRAFWRTRPIAPLALATAKLILFALLFVALPAAINAVRLVAYAAPLSALAAATVQIAVMAGAVVAPSWGLALATRTLPRFFAALAALFVGMIVALRMLVYWQHGGAQGGVGSVGFGVDPAGGASGLTAGLAIAVAFAILLAHYRLRRRLIALAAALVLIATVALLPEGRPAPAAPPVLAQLVAGRLRLPDGIGVPPSWSAQGSAGWPAYLSGRIELPPLPEKISAAVVLRETHVVVNGRRIPVQGTGQCCSGRGPIAAVAPAEAAPAVPAAPEPPIILGLSAPLVPEILGRRIAIQSDADVTFARHVLVASIPLRPGASSRTDRYLLEFLGLEPARRFVLIRFTRFPRFAEGDTEGLSLFLADPARTRVIATTPAWRVAPAHAASGSNDWAQGRTWSGRFQVLLTGIMAPPADAQLLIVETWPNGVAHTKLSVAEVEVRAPRLE